MNHDMKIQTLKFLFAATGGLIVHLLGGGDELLKLFGMLITVDFFMGVLKGLKTKTFRSAIMRWGAVNKALEAIVIMIFNQFDGAMHLDIFRNGALVWFCLCEAASLVENLILLDVPCPEGLHKTLLKLKVGIAINFVDIFEKLLEEKLSAKKGDENHDHQP